MVWFSLSLEFCLININVTEHIQNQRCYFICLVCVNCQRSESHGGDGKEAVIFDSHGTVSSSEEHKYDTYQRGGMKDDPCH